MWQDQKQELFFHTGKQLFKTVLHVEEGPSFWTEILVTGYRELWKLELTVINSEETNFFFSTMTTPFMIFNANEIAEIVFIDLFIDIILELTQTLN